ncbi:BI1-like protein isoform X1 [Selaginella moellendorffii]|uniref:BI1-like protein isoform X1 n=1 Tax=Selaginella moellendorffii TaxID=88036 RepID=UPI000D1D0CBC|nr:BI1-like protein isoform X1 [Selaginella moellendorffii]|eukprot:XP_024522064.1 BI1-like protein isoform X1 [Selaginella moellendorffii]
MYGSTSGNFKGGGGYADIETGYEPSGALYPGIDYSDNVLRWGFIRKVYGILSTQIVLTALVAAVIVFSQPVADFFAHNTLLLVLLALLPLILLCPLYNYQHHHPLNLVLLSLFTVFLSLSVGTSCAFIRGDVLLEALILTATVALALTAYTFWAVKQGHDFSFLRPYLFVSLVVLVLWGIIQVCAYRTSQLILSCFCGFQIFFPLGPVSGTIFAAITTVIFSAYIIYDTENLIRRFTFDEYIWASVSLYLDILNLFLALLNLLRGLQSNN